MVFYISRARHQRVTQSKSQHGNEKTCQRLGQWTNAEVKVELQPQLVTLNKLLAGRLFRIPQYQRAYSWTSKQRRDFFSDVDKVYSRPGTSHFMATVVGLRRENRIIDADEFHVIDVVDGQQRLTTIVILLKAN